jgi:biotin carboxyl carrier protein
VRLQVEVEGSTYDVEVEIVDKPTSAKATAPPSNGNGSALVAPAVPPESVLQSYHSRKRRKLRVSKDDGICRSPMCGVVISVNVKSGQYVEEDEVLVVLEAMKMESPVRAPRSGHITTLNVRPGDKVLTDQVMLEIADLSAETGATE